MAKAKKTSRSAVAAKKTLIHRIKTYNFFLVFAILLGMIAGVLLVKALYRGEPVDTTPIVNLGAIQYDFSSGKAVKRQSPALDSLQAFLTKAAKKDCTAIQSDLEPSEYQVIAATSDISQVLLGYGCGDTSGRMFALRDGDAWRFVSPTNHFEMLYGLPECGYVEQNAISKEIAPVCYNDSESAVTYSVR